MKWLFLNPDTKINDNTYYTDHEISLARNKFTKATQMYCDIWGYDYIRDENVYFDDYDIEFKGNSGWSLSTTNKLLQVKHHIKNYDYVCVMDTYDTLITNPSLPLTNFINDEDSLFISRDIYYNEKPFPDNVNSGWVIFKNDDNIHQLLDLYVQLLSTSNLEGDSYNDQNLLIEACKSMNMNDFVNYDDLLVQKYWFYNRPHSNEMKSGNYDRFHYLLNSPYLWKPNDFMIHLCGEPDRFRMLEGFYDDIYGTK